MEDVRLWRLLAEEPLDVEAVAPLLAQLAESPFEDRMVFAGPLRRCVAHPDPGIRALALRALRGAASAHFSRLFVAALDDPEPPVRQAGVEAVLERANWVDARSVVHVLFHPERSVRESALRAMPPPWNIGLALPLAADVVLRDALLGFLRRCGTHESLEDWQGLALRVLPPTVHGDGELLSALADLPWSSSWFAELDALDPAPDLSRLRVLGPQDLALALQEEPSLGLRRFDFVRVLLPDGDLKDHTPGPGERVLERLLQGKRSLEEAKLHIHAAVAKQLLARRSFPKRWLLLAAPTLPGLLGSSEVPVATRRETLVELADRARAGSRQEVELPSLSRPSLGELVASDTLTSSTGQVDLRLLHSLAEICPSPAAVYQVAFGTEPHRVLLGLASDLALLPDSIAQLLDRDRIRIRAVETSESLAAKICGLLFARLVPLRSAGAGRYLPQRPRGIEDVRRRAAFAGLILDLQSALRAKSPSLQEGTLSDLFGRIRGLLRVHVAPSVIEGLLDLPPERIGAGGSRLLGIAAKSWKLGGCPGLASAAVSPARWIVVARTRGLPELERAAWEAIAGLDGAQRAQVWDKVPALAAAEIHELEQALGNLESPSWVADSEGDDRSLLSRPLLRNGLAEEVRRATAEAALRRPSAGPGDPSGGATEAETTDGGGRP